MGIKQILQESIIGEFHVVAVLRIKPANIDKAPRQDHTFLLSDNNIRWAAQIVKDLSFRIIAGHCKDTEEEIGLSDGYTVQILYVRDSNENRCGTDAGGCPVMCSIHVPKPPKRPLPSSPRKLQN